MLRYLPGVLLIQVVTIAIFWANRSQELSNLMISAVLPSALIGFVTAFWFSNIARVDGERLLGKVRHEHAKEREKLQLNAERDKAKVIKQTHKTIRREERRVGRRANMKVGIAFMGAALAGVVMIITELFTLGLITITTAGGAMGGYLLRWKQARATNHATPLQPPPYEVVSSQEPASNPSSANLDAPTPSDHKPHSNP